MTDREPEVPKLPRGRGIRLTGPQAVKLVMVATLLIAVIVLQRPCADSVGRFIGSFDPPPPDAGAIKAVPTPEQLDPYRTDYVEIKPGMSEKEIQEAIEKARKQVPSTP